MNARKILILIVASLSITAITAAPAHAGWFVSAGFSHGYSYAHSYCYQPAYVRPVVVAPYYPARVVYAPTYVAYRPVVALPAYVPAPATYYPAPVYSGFGFSINVGHYGGHYGGGHRGGWHHR